MWSSISCEDVDKSSVGFGSDTRDLVAIVLARWKAYGLVLLFDAMIGGGLRSPTSSLQHGCVELSEFWSATLKV